MPVTQFTTKDPYRYQNGFDCQLEYEFIPVDSIVA